MSIQELAEMINEAKNYHISECVKAISCDKCVYNKEFDCKSWHTAEYLLNNGVKMDDDVMNKNLGNLISTIHSKTVLYANMAKEQRTLTILTDYTKPTVAMLKEYRFRSGVPMPAIFRIEAEINRIYAIEAQTEDYIRGEVYNKVVAERSCSNEAKIEKGN